MDTLNPAAELTPAIYLTHSHYDILFLYGLGFACFIVLIILFFSIYAAVKGSHEGRFGNGILVTLIKMYWGFALVMGGPFLVCLYLIFLSCTWSVTIGAQGIRLRDPLNLIDRGGVLAWSNIEKAKIIRRGRGGVPYISLEGQGTSLTFPIWDMDREDIQLTCNMIFSKLKDSQIIQSRETVHQICPRYGGDEDWLPSAVRLKKLYNRSEE